MNNQIRRNFKRIHSQIGKSGNILIFTVIEDNSDFIDNGILSIFLDLRLNVFTLIGAHVVLAQNLLDFPEADFNRFLVICSAVHSQQVLENISRDVGTLLHEGGEVFSDYLSRKIVQDFHIKLCHHLKASYYQKSKSFTNAISIVNSILSVTLVVPFSTTVR